MSMKRSDLEAYKGVFKRQPAKSAPPVEQFTKKELVAIHQALSFAEGESMLFEPGPSAGAGYGRKFARELVEKADRLARGAK